MVAAVEYGMYVEGGTEASSSPRIDLGRPTALVDEPLRIADDSWFFSDSPLRKPSYEVRIAVRSGSREIAHRNH